MPKAKLDRFVIELKLNTNDYDEFRIKHNELIEQMSKDKIEYPKSLGIKKIS